MNFDTKSKKLILVNDETSMRNPDSISGIYLTSDEAEQYRLVDENRREKEEAKRKQKRRHSSKSFIFNRSNVKLFRNSKTPCTVYFFLPSNNLCSETSLTYLQKSLRTPLDTLEVSLVKFLIM